MNASRPLKWLTLSLVLAGTLLAAACGAEDSELLLAPAGGASLSAEAPALSIKPITWNVIGLDGNDPTKGPNTFPVGVRVTNSGNAMASGVTAKFYFTTANAFINLSGPSVLAVPSLAPRAFADFYFEVAVTRDEAALRTARRYVISASATGVQPVSTPSPRELYVKRFVSQNRNQILAISGPASVNVGATVTYVLDASTAPGGYEQLTTLLNFPNTRFQVLSTHATYTAPAGALNHTIYANACGWQNDPTRAGYLSCVGPEQYARGKAGGNIRQTYEVKILGAGTTSLTGLIYDFSGASYHYNDDFGLNVLSITAHDSTRNTAPTANDDTYTASSGAALSAAGPGVLGNDTDAEGNPLTVILVSGPKNGTLTLNADGSFTYTPNAGFSGPDSFTYKVNDGALDSAPATVTLAFKLDNDGDGLSNDQEDARGTDPNNPDTDGDGLLDGAEDANHDGTLDPNETDPLNPDTDGGGVNDGEEVGGGLDPRSAWDDLDRVVVGSGCSATGNSSGSGLWIALGVLALVGRRAGRSRRLHSQAFQFLVAGGLAVALVSPGAARAQGTAPSLSTAIDVQQFKPAPGEADVLALYSPGVAGHLRWRAGFFLNYANEPLVMLNRADGALLMRLVDNQVGFDVIGAIGLGDRFEVSVVLPLSVQYGMAAIEPAGNSGSAWGGGVGDLRLLPKVGLFEWSALRIGLVAPLVLPTGGANAFRGQSGFGAQPRLIADYTFGSGLRLLANLGVNLRSRQELFNLSVGSELAYGVGAAFPFSVKGQKLEALASLMGAVGLGARGGTHEEEVPLELQGAVRYRINGNLIATLGLGRGIIRGYGMPSFRVLGGLAWAAEERSAPAPVREVDTDGDGMVDAQDKCPMQPEDQDGFRDEDGCPDQGVSKVRIQGDKLLILEKVYFATNEDVVLPRSFPLLQQVSTVLQTNPQLTKVRVEGHTDNRGDDHFNLDLSQRRASRVRAYLVEQGIAPERLEATGYGEARPVDTNDTESGRENNRRVGFTILATEQ